MFAMQVRANYLARFRSLFFIGWFFALLVQAPNSSIAQEKAAAEKIIDFARDVLPILEERCLGCHGPKQAKNDFRVDDQEILMSYIEPGDSSGSSLWTDYLTTADKEMLMPPASEKPLTGAQLASIKLWIDEGAIWPAAESVAPVAPKAKSSKVARVAAFVGLFHPAIVHFPIALLLISTVFSFLAFFKPSAFEGPAFHCLWIGAISAWAASLLGWFYADTRGYGGASFDFASGIDRHRWAAIGLSIFAVVLVPIAISARRNTKNRRMHVVWFGGSVVLAMIVSMVGHQGGELVYGEDIYTDAFNAIFEEDVAPTAEGSQANEEIPEVPSEVVPTDSAAANVEAQPTSPAEPAVAPNSVAPNADTPANDPQ